MNQVRYDSYQRGSSRRRVDGVSGLHFFLMFVAAGLLALTRVEHPIVIGLQDAGRQAAQPLLSGLNQLVTPLRNFTANAQRYFTVDTEFRRVERELATLRQLLERTSALAQRNEELAEAVRLVRASSVDAVTVEVIAGPRGLFGKSVEIGAGADHGLRYGQPVFSGDGFFGRIVSVRNDTARVLILNDVNSRIPVEVGARRRPALVVGDNSSRPRVIYLDGAQALRDGDAVVTSGASGEFPRGLMVGKISKANNELRVEPQSSLIARTFLTVLRYNIPSAIAADVKKPDVGSSGKEASSSSISKALERTRALSNAGKDGLAGEGVQR